MSYQRHHHFSVTLSLVAHPRKLGLTVLSYRATSHHHLPNYSGLTLKPPHKGCNIIALELAVLWVDLMALLMLTIDPAI
jgi:hypothetical protein